QGIMEGYPADEAGVEAGDVITKVGNERIHLYRQLSLISAINKGESLEIEYVRDGETYHSTIVPKFDEEAVRYYIGILGAGELIECKGMNLFKYAFYEMEYWFGYTFKCLKMLVSGQLTKDDVAGPVGMTQQIGETYEAVKPYGFSSVLFTMMEFATLISVNLGVLNLLPIPALDGGRLLFMLIEVVRGKPISPEKEGIVHLIGMAALFILMIFVLFNDVMRLFQ
ncbi:MAG: RIP metalloprotease RseP, partial [Lachnospiraceae bacterium]|nr:RIP metalloprotease RseP [Lachnospiraceae bacterium]